jgi:general secretion pathway protein J
MTRAGGDPYDRGFALVEALAALAVTAMIALMLLTGLATGRRVWEGVDTREASGEELESAQSMLRDRLEQAYSAVQYEANPPIVDFRGSGETVSFLANPPDDGRPAPIRRYSLSLDGAGELLLASVTDAAPNAAPADRVQVLLRGVRAIDIAYFGARNGDAKPSWGPLWRDQPALPDLVRVRLAFRPGDVRSWPELIVRPRMTIDANCQIDLGSHHCKGRS